MSRAKEKKYQGLMYDFLLNRHELLFILLSLAITLILFNVLFSYFDKITFVTTPSKPGLARFLLIIFLFFCAITFFLFVNGLPSYLDIHVTILNICREWCAFKTGITLTFIHNTLTFNVKFRTSFLFFYENIWNIIHKSLMTRHSCLSNKFDLDLCITLTLKVRLWLIYCFCKKMLTLQFTYNGWLIFGQTTTYIAINNQTYMLSILTRTWPFHDIDRQGHFFLLSLIYGFNSYLDKTIVMT